MTHDLDIIRDSRRLEKDLVNDLGPIFLWTLDLTGRNAERSGLYGRLITCPCNQMTLG